MKSFMAKCMHEPMCIQPSVHIAEQVFSRCHARPSAYAQGWMHALLRECTDVQKLLGRRNEELEEKNPRNCVSTVQKKISREKFFVEKSRYVHWTLSLRLICSITIQSKVSKVLEDLERLPLRIQWLTFGWKQAHGSLRWGELNQQNNGEPFSTWLLALNSWFFCVLKVKIALPL